MNEVKRCSLSGVAFTMDIEAYNELHDYLESLKKSYNGMPEGAEIIADIEARIAELILTAQDTSRVVGLPLIRNIIEQMGTADFLAAEQEENAPRHTSSERNPRRLYRDTENAKLGGVCAGIGKYFDIDPVWVRVVLFLPILLSCFGWVPLFYWVSPMMGNLFGVFVICYFVMWFAVPVARTARQKLEMNGERITVDSISRTAAANDPDATAKTVVADTVSIFGKVIMVLLKLFAGLIVFGLVMLAVALLIGLMAVLTASHEIVPTDIALGVPVLGIFAALAPTVMLIYVLMCLIASRKPNGRAILVMFLLWICTIIGCATLAIYDHSIPKAANHIEQMEVDVDGEKTTLGEIIDEVKETGEYHGKLTIEKNNSNQSQEAIVKENSDQSQELPKEAIEAFKTLEKMECVKIKIDGTEENPKKVTIEACGTKIMEVEVNE